MNSRCVDAQWGQQIAPGPEDSSESPEVGLFVGGDEV